MLPHGADMVCASDTPFVGSIDGMKPAAFSWRIRIGDKVRGVQPQGKADRSKAWTLADASKWPRPCAQCAQGVDVAS